MTIKAPRKTKIFDNRSNTILSAQTLSYLSIFQNQDIVQQQPSRSRTKMEEEEPIQESESQVIPCNNEVAKFDSSEDSLKRVSTDLASFVDIDNSKQIDDVEKVIDGLLAKLEEYCSVIDQIRSESKDVLFTTAPILYERCKELQPIFDKIDHLEKFMAVVKDCVEDTEEKVNTAEKELGSKNIKKILKSVPMPKFFLQKKSIQPYLKTDVRPSNYVPPKLFKTEDFFQRYDNNAPMNIELLEEVTLSES